MVYCSFELFQTSYPQLHYISPSNFYLTVCMFRDQNKAHESKDDFYQGFEPENYDFSDKVSQSTFLFESEDIVKSDLDSSFSQLSEDLDEQPIKISSKQLSSFSKFKNDQRNSPDGSVDVSDNESDDGQLETEKKEMKQEKRKTESSTPPKPQKKRRRRRDVIFKRILRECRRFFQVQLSELTGFVCSKKPRKDDFIYR